MSISLTQTLTVGAYVVKKQLAGVKRYPLVLMLEPLYRCNLACAGCGKIDYPDEILNQRLSVEQCLGAIDECGAPGVVIAGGEPLLHRDLHKIVEGAIARKKITIVCTNALLLLKHIHKFKPSRFFSWSIHLDGDKEMHDRSVCQDGVYEKALEAIEVAKAKGFNVQVNCTVFDGADPDRVAAYMDDMKRLGAGVTISPGYAYERAPDQEHFLSRNRTKSFFRELFKRGKGKGWEFTQSDVFLNFLAGNETFECTPWSMPARTVFGWQRPCYLLGEGYVETFKELMEDTRWDDYGVGNYEKCADCMVHCGFEGTAVKATLSNPLHAAKVSLFGIKTNGAFAPDIPLTGQRPAEYVFSAHVEEKLAEIRAGKSKTLDLRKAKRRTQQTAPAT
ncbi:MAG TPA: adenosyl-hopene transferase HpnH [Caulobacteraceae bacterium]|nr:adenosyl-hopene transferase HpnH [Caulobacteraceae bacterium]